MRILFEVFVNLIETFISVDFITKYLGPKYEGRKKTAAFIAVWMAAFAELCAMNSFTEFESIGSYIPIAIYFCYSLLCLRGSVTLKLWISVLAQLIITLTATVTNVLVCSVIGYDPYKMITVFNATRVIGVITAKIFHFCVTRLVLKFKRENPISKKRFASLAVIPVVSVISLCALAKATFVSSETKPYILAGMVCIVLANIMTYYFFTVINKEHENDLKIKLLEIQNDNSKTHVEELNTFVRKMRSVRHDMKNQLLIIGNYIDSGETEKAKNYINILTNDYLPNVQDFINTGNDALDAVINSKIALCNQKGIFMEVTIKKDTSVNLPLTQTAALFGNLLDNAIEAARHTERKRISLDIRQEGVYLSILVRNSIASSVLETNQELETSKKDKETHGVGLRSVKSVVNRYNGMIQFFEEDGEFCCHIMLEINK